MEVTQVRGSKGWLIWLCSTDLEIGSEEGLWSTAMLWLEWRCSAEEVGGTALAGVVKRAERSKGAVSGKVYAQYFAAAYGQILIPLLIFSAIFMQGAQVMSGYWLVYWQENKWHRSPRFYVCYWFSIQS